MSVFNLEALEDWSYRFFVGALFSITFSIALGETFLGLSILCFLVHMFASKTLPVLPRTVWLALLFACIAIPSAIYGSFPARGIKHISRIFWFLCIPLSASLITSKDRVFSLMKAISFGCVIVSLQHLVHDPIYVLRNMGQGSVYAGVSFLDALIDQGSMTGGQMLMFGVIMTMGIIFVSVNNGKSSKFWILLLVVQFLALLLNFKRGTWFAAGIVVTVFAVLRIGWKALIGVCLLAFLVFLLPPVRYRLSELSSELSPNSHRRMTMWVEIAPRLVKERPWFGWGYGSTTNRLFQKYHIPVEEGRSHLHSNPVQVIVETGIVGFTVYFLWMLSSVVAGLMFVSRCNRKSVSMKIMAQSCFLALIGLYINGLVEYNFGDTELLIVMLSLMGVMGSDLDSNDIEEKSWAQTVVS